MRNQFCLFCVWQTSVAERNGFGEELGIGGHMYVRFFHIFFFIGDECIFVGDAGQDAEWVFKCFSDGAFDTLIGYIGVSVAS